MATTPPFSFLDDNTWLGSIISIVDGEASLWISNNGFLIGIFLSAILVVEVVLGVYWLNFYFSANLIDLVQISG